MELGLNLGFSLIKGTHFPSECVLGLSGQILNFFAVLCFALFSASFMIKIYRLCATWL